MRGIIIYTLSVKFSTNVGACLRLGSGYKVSVLASLCEGETLMIGGKEAEVMGVISPEDFAKGRCFQDSQAAQTEPEAKSGPQPSSAHGSVSKPFCPPTSLRGDRGGCRPEEEQTCKPRHDPTAPGDCRVFFAVNSQISFLPLKELNS